MNGTIINPNSIVNYFDSLTELLCNSVDSGASVGFVPPLEPNDARAYWSTVEDELQNGSKEIILVLINGRAIGSVQMLLPVKQNASHRCEMQKLMVHTDYRGKGFGRQLVGVLEESAAALNRSLIILYTRKGDIASRLYLDMGYIQYGEVPRYAQSKNGLRHTTVFFYKDID